LLGLHWRAGPKRPDLKCRATQLAGTITGLFAGVGIAIAVGKLDFGAAQSDWVHSVATGVLILLGTVGGSAAGASTGGCLDPHDESRGNR
jgi:hypothetical protein